MGYSILEGRVWHLSTKVQCICFLRKVINEFWDLNGSCSVTDFYKFRSKSESCTYLISLRNRTFGPERDFTEARSFEEQLLLKLFERPDL